MEILIIIITQVIIIVILTIITKTMSKIRSKKFNDIDKQEVTQS